MSENVIVAKNNVYLSEGETVNVVSGKTGSGKTFYVTEKAGELSKAGKRVKFITVEGIVSHVMESILKSVPNAELGNIAIEHVGTGPNSIYLSAEDIINLIDKESVGYDVVIVDFVLHTEVEKVIDHYEGKSHNAEIILVTQLSSRAKKALE